MSDSTLASLLQLSSPTLPVGAFSYSQGLEQAVAAGLVRDEPTVEDWLGSIMRHGVAAWDAPWVAELMRAWRSRDYEGLTLLNERFLASRETRELRSETLQMGRSLLVLLRDTRELPPESLAQLLRIDAADGLSYPVAWAAAAVQRGLRVDDALVGYLWSWLENAVMAALKTASIGQTAGQRLLRSLGIEIERLAAEAALRPIDRCCNLLPGFTLACMQHETLYARLFRS